MTAAPRRGVPRTPSWYAPTTAVAGTDPDAPLVLVHGPAGAGKSLLVAAWVRTRVPADRAVVWVDAGAAPAPGGTWERVLAALAAAGLLPDPTPAEIAATRRDAAATAVDALHALRAPTLLVLDGYEHIASPGTDASLVHVLARVDRLHVAVTTRRDPRALRDAAALHLDVAALGPDDLALDDAAVAELLRRAGTDPETATSAAPRVRAATGGLALGVRAVAVAASRGGTDLASATGTELVQVAARGVVPALRTGRGDDDLLDAARRVSVAETLTADLADALVGDAAAGLLDRLEADGLGTWQDDVFTLTPLVRTTLRAGLTDTDPAAVPHLLREVAARTLAAGRFTEALHAAAQTEDLDLVQHVVTRTWAVGHARDGAEIIRVLDTLPRSAVARRPVLALLVALLHNTRPEHRVRAVEWFAIAAGAAVYHLPRATSAERALLRAGESVAARLLGRGGRARTAAVAALDHLARTSPGEDPTVDALRGLLHRQLGLGLVAAGDVEQGLHVIEGALAHDEPGPLAAFSTYGLLAGLSAAHGDLGAARHLVAVAAALEPPPAPGTAYRRSTVTLARAYLALEDGDAAAAGAVLDSVEVELRTNEFWPAFAEVRATVDLMTGRAVAGGAVLDDRMRRGRRAPATAAWRARLLSTRSLLALAAGQAEAGVALLAPVPSSRPAARVARARLLLSTHRSPEAVALLAAPDLADEGPRSRVTRRLLLAAALAHQEPGSEPADRALREAAAAVALGGSATGWLLLTAADRAAVHGLADRLAEPDVHRFLQGLGHLPVVLPDAQDAVGLSEREVVVLRELADDAGLAEVAVRLGVTHNTVKTQVRSAYRKLGVRSRADAVTRARELGLI